jgi:hypothetical protein
MNIRQLIKELEKHPWDAGVYICNKRSDWLRRLTKEDIYYHNIKHKGIRKNIFHFTAESYDNQTTSNREDQESIT